jgi:hypothetical protein
MDLENKSREQLMREVAKEAAREAVHEALFSIGVNSRRPQDIQADLIYLNRLRRSREQLFLRILSVCVGVIIPAFLFLVWEMLKTTLRE